MSADPDIAAVRSLIDGMDTNYPNALAALARIEARLAETEARLGAADWYITCLEDVRAKTVVRGLGEAQAAYRALAGKDAA